MGHLSLETLQFNFIYRVGKPGTMLRFFPSLLILALYLDICYSQDEEDMDGIQEDGGGTVNRTLEVLEEDRWVGPQACFQRPKCERYGGVCYVEGDAPQGSVEVQDVNGNCISCNRKYRPGFRGCLCYYVPAPG